MVAGYHHFGKHPYVLFLMFFWTSISRFFTRSWLHPLKGHPSHLPPDTPDEPKTNGIWNPHSHVTCTMKFSPVGAIVGSWLHSFMNYSLYIPVKLTNVPWKINGWKMHSLNQWSPILDDKHSLTIWGFQKIGVPQNGRFIMEKPF